MRLLLTSSGIANKSIAGALLELVGRPFSEVRLVFMPTAADVEPGDKWWLIQDLDYCRDLGFVSVDIVDVAAVPRSVWEPRIRESDVVMVGGGNTYFLMHWLNASGLAGLLPELLKSRVYVGTSAGSIVATHSLRMTCSESMGYEHERPLGFVRFHVRPHLNSPYFPGVRRESMEKMAREIKEPIYALDDQSAVKVRDGKVEVVSEGESLVFNA